VKETLYFLLKAFRLLQKPDYSSLSRETFIVFDNFTSLQGHKRLQDCGCRLPQPGQLTLGEELLGYHNNNNSRTLRTAIKCDVCLWSIINRWTKFSSTTQQSWDHHAKVAKKLHLLTITIKLGLGKDAHLSTDLHYGN